MEIKKISRNVALKEYKTRYFTGNPCANGHICERLSSNGSCVDCGKIKLKSKLKELRINKRLNSEVDN